MVIAQIVPVMILVHLQTSLCRVSILSSSSTTSCCFSSLNVCTFSCSESLSTVMDRRSSFSLESKASFSVTMLSTLHVNILICVERSLKMLSASNRPVHQYTVFSNGHSDRPVDLESSPCLCSLSAGQHSSVSALAVPRAEP